MAHGDGDAEGDGDGQLCVQLLESSGLYDKKKPAPAAKKLSFLPFSRSAGKASAAGSGDDGAVVSIMYFCVSVGGQRARSTSQFLRSPSPNWMEEFVFATRNRQEEQLHLELYERLKENDASVRSDPVLGECFIPLARLP
eukprot:CAMPEP_0118872514 /NCGR_PEP_ID=MMETSP1163-20130328/14679_1 /TAXON_ID=124430 /ORGANISM="Phaeomonas parva, Strain CCMP2877" /LENGTH=139 /DNA_ID=CAMNT_0006807709 /DNA_START=22 /DNA_END=437 /DNA_ORIENTATION=+